MKTIVIGHCNLGTSTIAKAIALEKDKPITFCDVSEKQRGILIEDETLLISRPHLTDNLYLPSKGSKYHK